MSWSWSHTAEAYENARENLSRKPIKDLIVILAEWQAREMEESEETGEMVATDNLDSEKYEAEVKRLKRELKRGVIDKESLADSIWPLMEEQATCTNGGWEAHCCPFGCGCHMVSFSTPEELRNGGLRKWREKKHER